jgi:hypothetical protein
VPSIIENRYQRRFVGEALRQTTIAFGASGKSVGGRGYLGNELMISAWGRIALTS